MTRTPAPHAPTTELAPEPADVEITPHEFRIAKLVTEGMTNGEISTTLHVSRRTVEFHLTNLYRKLGIARRSQIATALLTRGLL
jgi:DNA-binding CsgD family transcriptional regulator